MGDVRLIGIFGQLGCYKTALAVVLARAFSSAFNIPVVSNTPLINVPNSRTLEMDELVGNEYIDTVLLEDEIYALADSRLSMSTQSIYYTYSIAQARKSPLEAGGRGIGNYVIYTAQLTSMPDIRLFELTNLYLTLSKDEMGNCEVESVTDEGESNSTVIPKDFFVRHAFPYYKTHEKVMPLAIDNLTIELQKYMPLKLNARVDKIVDEFLASFKFNSWRDVQRFTVQDFMYRRGYSDKLVVPVFNRVREVVRVSGLVR